MATHIVYVPADRAAAELIFEKHPDYVLYGITPETATEPEPLEIAENHLVLIGGSYANPYTQKYFFDTGIIYDDTENEVIVGPGVYANGKRCITSVVRDNGTTVTAIFGWHALDTFRTVEDFVSSPFIQYLLPIGAGIGGLLVGYTISRARK